MSSNQNETKDNVFIKFKRLLKKIILVGALILSIFNPFALFLFINPHRIRRKSEIKEVTDLRDKEDSETLSKKKQDGPP